MGPTSLIDVGPIIIVLHALTSGAMHGSTLQ